MKYFSPSYWFKLWVLSAPLFNDKTQGINANSIDNKNIKDWANNNTSDISLIENQELNLSNNQITLLDLPLWNINLTTHNEHHKHRHQKSRNRYKRQHKINNPKIFKIKRILTVDNDNVIKFFNNLMRIIREELNMENIVSRIQNRNSESHNPNSLAYFINGNNQQYNYFSINVNINERILILFYRSSDLYLPGFISRNTYHYFNGDRPDNSDVLTDHHIEKTLTLFL